MDQLDNNDLGSINLRPNKPDSYNGARDFLIISTWLYKIEQYIQLVQLTNPNFQLTEANKILFASTFLTETAAVWWFTQIQSNIAPTTWVDFKNALTREFIPEDHIRRARDKLRRCKQGGSVSKYITEFRNAILAVQDVGEGEKFDRFVEGLKPTVRMEVMKSTVGNFEDATKIALRVDSALWGLTGQGQSGSASSGSSPTPMEIGNMQGGTKRPLTEAQKKQREIDRINNACFKCHTVGCRPYRCRHKKAQVNNTEIQQADGEKQEHEVHLSDSDSGKE